LSSNVDREDEAHQGNDFDLMMQKKKAENNHRRYKFVSEKPKGQNFLAIYIRMFKVQDILLDPSICRVETTK